MTRSESQTEISKALVKCQAMLKPAKKDSENPHFRSRYANLQSCWDACREALTSNGLCLLQSPFGCSDTPGRIGLETRLMHTSGEWLAGQITIDLAKTDPQAVGSALTYLRRYSLSAFIGLVADDDDDGNAAMPAPPTAPPKTAAAPPRKPTPATDPKDADYHRRVRRALRQIHGDDKAAALRQVEEMTSFVGKNGEHVSGVRDFTKLTGKRLEILAHKLEKLAPNQPIEREADLLPTDPGDYDEIPF